MRIPPERTPRFDAFVAPARARPALWRTAAGAFLAAALWLLTVGAALPFAMRAGGFGSRPGVLLYLASFAGLLLGVALAARLLQRRGPATLLGPGGFRPAAFGAGVAVIALLALPSAAALAFVAPPVRQAGLATWAAWLPLALPLVLLQSAAEEAAFRGYLMQSLAARFRSPLVWWLLPAIGFGLLHWSPGALGPNAGLGVLAAVAVGLFLGDVTARTGNLSAAIGLHFANNVMALLIVALPSPVSGLALFLADVGAADPAATRALLIGDLAGTLVAWAIWRRLAGRGRLHSEGPGSI